MLASCEMFNIIDVNTKYCVKGGKFLFRLSFSPFVGMLFTNYDFRTLAVNKTSIMASKCIILYFKGIYHAYAFF